jgi:reactive intermediate/imine deaminase
MSRTKIETDETPHPAGAYSQAIAAGGFLYTAGFGPQDPATGQVIGDTIEVQTEQVMKNVAGVLTAHGLDFSNVVKATVHLQHLDRDFAGFNSTYAQFLSTPACSKTSAGRSFPPGLLRSEVATGFGPPRPLG